MAKDKKEMANLNANALYKLSQQYEYALDGFQVDIPKSLSLLKQAANLEHPKALYTLWHHYQNGEAAPYNPKKADEYLQRLKKVADQKKDPLAQFLVGTIYESLKEDNSDNLAATAFKYYEMSAKQELPEGLHHLALCYENGIGTDENEDLRFKYHKLAAEKGNTNSQISVAFIYLNSRSTDAEKQRAFNWLKKIDKSTISRTMAETVEDQLADCYEEGWGTQKNLLYAVEHRRLAEEYSQTTPEIEQRAKEIESAKKEYQEQLNKRIYGNEVASPKAASPSEGNNAFSPKKPKH